MQQGTSKELVQVDEEVEEATEEARHDISTGNDNNNIGEEDYRIQASDRLQFDINWELIKHSTTWRHTLRTKRNTGSSHISWIWLHGVKVAKVVAGELKGRYFICRLCHDKKKVQLPRTAHSTTSITYHLEHDHGLTANGQLADSGAINDYFKPEQWQQSFEAEQ
ncbi:hypothetical protein EJ02DRAFT_427741 [Clathrospora elynae]|uniref:BED-type domain-containing protein n=1 Tax=Clathrospora elynae TaxID=706981 RepID=A0A6A5S8U3_9PLEO|nr:hypothetical protein EJ02DRAFT_427741 [Clathrospora elynae]